MHYWALHRLYCQWAATLCSFQCFSVFMPSTFPPSVWCFYPTEGLCFWIPKRLVIFLKSKQHVYKDWTDGLCQTFCSIFFFFKLAVLCCKSQMNKSLYEYQRTQSTFKESSLCVLMCWNWGRLLKVASHCVARCI